MRKTSTRHRIASVAVATVLAAGAAVATTTSAEAAPTSVPASTAAVHRAVAAVGTGTAASVRSAPALPAAAPVYSLVGIFPDPFTCTLAGISTGRPFYCGFYFFFWGLNVA